MIDYTYIQSILCNFAECVIFFNCGKELDALYLDEYVQEKLFTHSMFILFQIKNFVVQHKMKILKLWTRYKN